MARLYIFAEGATEQTYGDNVLKNHLATFGVYVVGPVLIAHAKRKGRVHRGGGRKYQPMRNDIMRFITQEKAVDTFFTTMIDLYGIHSDFPGLAEVESIRHLFRERAKSWKSSSQMTLATQDSSRTSNCTSLKLYSSRIPRHLKSSTRIAGNRWLPCKPSLRLTSLRKRLTTGHGRHLPNG